MIDRETVERTVRCEYEAFVQRQGVLVPQLRKIPVEMAWTGAYAAHALVGDLQVQFSDRNPMTDAGTVQHEWDLDFGKSASYNGILWRNPSLQGRGIGSALVDVRERIARKLGIRRVIIGISDTDKSTQFWRGHRYSLASPEQIDDFARIGVRMEPAEHAVLYKEL